MCFILNELGSHWKVLSTFYLFMYSFIYFWLCWVFVSAQTSLVVVSRGYFLVAVHGLFIAVASLVVEHGL